MSQRVVLEQCAAICVQARQLLRGQRALLSLLANGVKPGEVEISEARRDAAELAIDLERAEADVRRAIEHADS